MKHREKHRDETSIRTRQQEITETLKQRKTNSWTPAGLTRARVLESETLHNNKQKSTSMIVPPWNGQ